MPVVNFTNPQRQAFCRKLLVWYDANARVLPWRISPSDRKKGITPDPYRVWLSEIMLQQTTVATVGPRFEIFLNRWPKVEAMAASTEADILEEWAGLGYYARARNLYKCAKVVVGSFGGKFPKTQEELLTLPGIGDYTAAAVSAIAFDQPSIVVDGNIERVASRIFAIDTPLPASKPKIKEAMAILWPKKRSGDFAQCLMDLGATICTPKNPKCEACPIVTHCEANRMNIASTLPIKKKKALKPTRYGVAFATFNEEGDVWLVRRPDKGLLAGTLGLPGTGWTERQPSKKNLSGKSLGKVKHTFTHFHLVLEVVLRPTPEGIGGWENKNVRVPTVMRKAINVVLEHRGELA